jgi:hypothetical protein
MRIMTLALGTVLVLCNPFSAATHVRKAKVVREPRPIIRVPVVRTDRVDPSVIGYKSRDISTAVDLAGDVDFAPAILASRE